MFVECLKILSISLVFLCVSCQKSSGKNIGYSSKTVHEKNSVAVTPQSGTEAGMPSVIVSPSPGPLLELTRSQEWSGVLSSRFNCRAAKRAATVAKEVYPVTLGEISSEELARTHRAEHFEVFNARTGGATGEEAARGFVEYIPSELELALENTPEDAPIEFETIGTHREAVLVFRGTMGDFNGPDWLTNRDMTAAHASRLHPHGTGLIHRGFLEAYLSAQDTLRGYFEETFVRKSLALEQQLRSRLVRSGVYTPESIERYVHAVLDDYQVLITGHSLGGALATLAAYDFALNYVNYREKLSLITFAAPASLYGVRSGESLHQFAHLMARGTQFGNQYSAIFFERDGDIVHEDTARENFGVLGAAVRTFLYHGNAAPFQDRPENSGLVVKMDRIPNQGIFNSIVDFLTRGLTLGMINLNFLPAHSMEYYKNDIFQYCDEMDELQRCLNFGSLTEEQQQECARLGMDAGQSLQYLDELQRAGRTHMMDHPRYERIPHQDAMLLSTF